MCSSAHRLQLADSSSMHALCCAILLVAACPTPSTCPLEVQPVCSSKSSFSLLRTSICTYYYCMQALAGSNKGIVDEVIYLEVTGPSCPNLTIFDLPGELHCWAQGSGCSLCLRQALPGAPVLRASTGVS